MADQEKYKNLMQKMIQETEHDHRIQSAEEMIQKLINELSGKTNVHPDH